MFYLRLNTMLCLSRKPHLSKTDSQSRQVYESKVQSSAFLFKVKKMISKVIDVVEKDDMVRDKVRQ